MENSNFMSKSGLLYFSTLVAQALGLKANKDQVSQDIATALAAAQNFANAAVGALAGVIDATSISYDDMEEGKVYWKDFGICFKSVLNTQMYDVIKIRRDGLFIDEFVKGRTHQEERITAWKNEIIAKNSGITETKTPDEIRQETSPGYGFISHFNNLLFVGKQESTGKITMTVYGGDKIVHKVAEANDTQWTVEEEIELKIDSVLDLQSTRPVQNKTIKAALDLKAPLASPALTGTPTAPTPSSNTNNTQIATTAFVQQALAAAIAGRFKFVASLPNSGEAGFIYLVPHVHTEPSAHTSPDIKDEFVWDSENSKWELIGNTDIDLSNYWSKDDLVAMTNEEILAAWNTATTT